MPRISGRTAASSSNLLLSTWYESYPSSSSLTTSGSLHNDRLRTTYHCGPGKNNRTCKFQGSGGAAIHAIGTHTAFIKGGHTVAVAAAHDTAAAGIAHLPSSYVVHGSVAYAGATATGATAAGAAGGITASIAALVASAWTYYNFMSRVSEYRKKIGRDKDHFFDNKGVLYDMAGTGESKCGLVDQLLVEAFHLLNKDVVEWEHRNKDSEIKKRIDEVERCTECNCQDLH